MDLVSANESGNISKWAEDKANELLDGIAVSWAHGGDDKARAFLASKIKFALIAAHQNGDPAPEVIAERRLRSSGISLGAIDR